MNARILANLVTALGLAVAVTGPANAIVNGGFDNGTFNGWTEFGDSFFARVECEPLLPPSFVTSPPARPPSHQTSRLVAVLRRTSTMPASCSRSASTS